jgi:hypothetical protein
MEDDKLEFLPPDYSEYPREEDEDLDDEELEDFDDDEDDSEDLRIESLLDKQSKYNEDLARSESIELEQAEEREMSNTPFGSSDQPWRTGNSNNNNNGASETAPWEKQTQQSTGFGGSWGNSGGSSWNNIGSSWGSPTNNQKPAVDYTKNEKTKSILIVDALDCLVESYDSNGKPGILPRAIFDLKPKFDVWERLASFNPRRIFVLFPAVGLVPSIGNTESAKVASEYLAQCIAAYLRIPRDLCSIIHVKDNAVKEQNISGIVSFNKCDRNSILYVGVRSGRFGLSSEDISAAKKNGIDYMDLYNLLKGRYVYE